MNIFNNVLIQTRAISFKKSDIFNTSKKLPLWYTTGI